VDNVNSNDPTAARHCSCGASASNNRTVKWTAAGGVLSALGVCAACCLLPFGLLSVGIAGAWVSTLDALAPYKWAFISLTAALLGYGFYAVHFRSTQRCAAGPACEASRSGRTARIVLWIATILAISGLVFERLEPMLRSK
jgi:mercuric ion transport protein